MKTIEPDVLLFVDEDGAIFWIADGEYVWLQEGQDYNSFIDDAHSEEEIYPHPEGVRPRGVFWKNIDLEAPFHISEFTERISQMTDEKLRAKLTKILC